jgi:hypothetical protein
VSQATAMFGCLMHAEVGDVLDLEGSTHVEDEPQTPDQDYFSASSSSTLSTGSSGSSGSSGPDDR